MAPSCEIEKEKESRVPAKMGLDSVRNTWTDEYGTVWTPSSAHEESGNEDEEYAVQN